MLQFQAAGQIPATMIADTPQVNLIEDKDFQII